MEESGANIREGPGDSAPADEAATPLLPACSAREDPGGLQLSRLTPRLRRGKRLQGLEVASAAAGPRGNRDHGEISEEHPGPRHREALTRVASRVRGYLGERSGAFGKFNTSCRTG